jgi:hypothetical protein
MGAPMPLANRFRELRRYIRYLPKNLSMRHGNPIAETLKFVLTSAAEIATLLAPRGGRLGRAAAGKKDGPAVTGPSS